MVNLEETHLYIGREYGKGLKGNRAEKGKVVFHIV
jgi:hypothetical protein